MKATLGRLLHLAPTAQAVCVGASVNSFGAKGDGHTEASADLISLFS